MHHIYMHHIPVLSAIGHALNMWSDPIILPNNCIHHPASWQFSDKQILEVIALSIRGVI